MLLARTYAGMSCADVARSIGIHRDSYALLEKKADRISLDHFERFCRSVCADPSFILYGSSSPPLIPLYGRTIGDRIREYRLSTGLSARQFGYIMLGAKRSTSLSAWESGSTVPELRSLMMISRAFGINVVSFLPD